jgi:hypothetical protein
MLEEEESGWRKIIFSHESMIEKGFEGRYRVSS